MPVGGQNELGESGAIARGERSGKQLLWSRNSQGKGPIGKLVETGSYRGNECVRDRKYPNGVQARTTARTTHGNDGVNRGKKIDTRSRGVK